MAYESKWWNMRSGELVNSSSISRESSDSVSKFFSRRDWKSREIYLSLVAMLATTLTLVGIVALLGEYWIDLSGGVQMIVGLIPMAAGYFIFYYAFNNRSDSKFLMEAACIFCMTMIGFSLVLEAFYFESLREPKLFVFWMLLSLPVIYMSGSSFGALKYLGLVYLWLMVKATSMMGLVMMAMRNDYTDLLGGAGAGASSDAGVWGWLFILLILPHFFDHFDRPSFNTRKIVLGFLGMYYVYNCALMMFVGHSFFGISFLFVCIYMLGKDYFSDGAFWWNRPLQSIVIFATVLASVIFSFEEVHPALLRSQGYNEGALSSSTGWFAMIVNYLVLFGLAAGAVVSVLNDMKGDKKANLFIVGFPLVALVAIILDKLTEGSADYSLGAWLFTIYIITMGIDYTIRGMKNNNYAATAIGVVILLIMINAKFYYHLKDITDGDGVDQVIGLFNLALAGGLTWFALTFYKQTSKE